MWFPLQSQCHHRMTRSSLPTMTVLVCKVLYHTWGWSHRFKRHKCSPARTEVQISALGTHSHMTCSLLSTLVSLHSSILIWKFSHIAVNQGNCNQVRPLIQPHGILALMMSWSVTCRAGQSLRACLLRSFNHDKISTSPRLTLLLCGRNAKGYHCYYRKRKCSSHSLWQILLPMSFRALFYSQQN